jgi:hypothetical protein
LRRSRALDRQVITYILIEPNHELSQDKKSVRQNGKAEEAKNKKGGYSFTQRR